MANITQYTLEQKREAAILYATLGSYTKVADKLQYPVQTVYSWSTDWEGWDELIRSAQKEKAEEHRATYARIVDKAQAQTLAKLPEATAAQANIIAATATDKVRLLDNQPTSISGRSDSLESLKETFRKLSSTHTIVPNSKIIDSKGPTED